MYKVKRLSYQTNAEATTRIGRLVYRHPKGYFITLEFDGKLGKVRESFYPEEIMEV
jgi:hypothetical protein